MWISTAVGISGALILAANRCKPFCGWRLLVLQRPEAVGDGLLGTFGWLLVCVVVGAGAQVEVCTCINLCVEAASTAIPGW